MQDKLSQERSSGVLLHITSLPSSHGIGDLGSSAEHFIDYLSKMNQKFWQILPTNDPENFNSPYDSNSAFAQNTLLISLELLLDDGFLSRDDIKTIPSFTGNRVDFESVKKWKYPILEKAANNFYNTARKNDLGYQQFCQENSFWLDDYAVFKLIKNLHSNSSWKDWNPSYRKFNKKLMGRNSAGASFLKGYFTNGNPENFWVYAKQRSQAQGFADILSQNSSRKNAKYIAWTNFAELKDAGNLFFPGPNFIVGIN